ncbi:muconolactone Delta-isomerase [Sinomonas cyclohexanicum]|uniref:Muconolactone Delta-isomerase n=1 Tax=Sinomonas cyclohexanicum TaxID=322009 RepID=A0ABM7Q0V9_SINCY|nr:muconolactone Delta-isomerase family protein [Corynebacterium cyclohexanicum]BCT78211.1 muconolactone Delta-isomerase [Corynebacterium cyclohexanicum]
MEFLVRQENRMPALPADEAARIKAAEREYARQLRDRGILRRLWRVPGTRTAIGWYEAEDPTVLHEVLSGLPTFQWQVITVEALATHPQEQAPPPEPDLPPGTSA